jgi:hypothetical protein
MQRDRSNAPALVRDAGKLCPDCDHRLPREAFYVRANGQLSAYCKPHQRARAKASYRRRRQDPGELARMRQADRTRKRASRARLNARGSGHEAWLAKSRTTATRRLIATHLEEYRQLLADERAQRHRGSVTVEGGAPDAA